ncbi:MAG: hypothetical protein WAU60_15550 [Candidatus Competibacter denitrificans]|jgi:hypothetical protein
MWQDALALLIVAIAGLALLKPYIPIRRSFANDCRKKGGAAAVPPTALSGCTGCTLGSSACVKAQAGIDPTVFDQNR